MGGKGGGGSSTTVQKADPWSGLQPYLSQLYGSAGNWFNSATPQYFPGNTFAPQTPAQQQALQLGTTRAIQGSPNVNAAQDQNLNTINGGYLNSNPYLDQMYKSATTPMVDQYQNAIAPSIMSQFSIAGRGGSNSNLQALQSSQQPLAQGLASAAANIYGGNYENERQRQQSAMMMAPQLAGQDYTDLNYLMGIGQNQQETAQNQLNSQIARYDYGQNQPLAKMQALNALLQGGQAYGTQSSTGTQKLPSNPFMGALGGASGAYGLGQMIGGMTGSTAMGAIGGPVGLGIGALLGGLFG